MNPADKTGRGEGSSPALGKPSRASVLLAFAAIYLIWGSTYLGIRIAVETMPPFLMAGMRFAIAGLLIFGFLKARGAAWPTIAQWKDQVIVGLFLLLGGNAVVSWAEQRTPSGITCLILGASPMFMVIMDWIRPRGNRPSAVLVAGVVVGMLGVGLLIGPGGIPEGYRPAHPGYPCHRAFKHKLVDRITLQQACVVADAASPGVGDADGECVCLHVIDGLGFRGGEPCPPGGCESNVLDRVQLPGRRGVGDRVSGVCLAS